MKDLISNSKLGSEEVLTVSKEGGIRIFFGFIAKSQRSEKKQNGVYVHFLCTGHGSSLPVLIPYHIPVVRGYRTYPLYTFWK